MWKRVILTFFVPSILRDMKHLCDWFTVKMILKLGGWWRELTPQEGSAEWCTARGSHCGEKEEQKLRSATWANQPFRRWMRLRKKSIPHTRQWKVSRTLSDRNYVAHAQRHMSLGILSVEPGLASGVAKSGEFKLYQQGSLCCLLCIDHKGRDCLS